MQFPLKAVSLVLTAMLLSGASFGQVDPCDPGGAKFDTKDCPEQKKSDVKKLQKKIGSVETKSESSQKAASPSAPVAASASAAQLSAAAPASTAKGSPAKARKRSSASAAKKSGPNASAKKKPAKKDEAPPKN